MSNKYTPEVTSEFFKKFNERQEITQNSYAYITHTLDTALPQQDYSAILSLLPYMTSGDGQYAFRYTGDGRRIFRLLSIISLEHKYKKQPFCHDCFSTKELLDKYAMVLFHLRRLTFYLSDDSVNEALVFLRNQQLSPYAFYLLIHNELIVNNAELHSTISALYADLWSAEDAQQFIALTQKSQNN